MDIIETKIKRAHNSPTLHYRFKKDNFFNLFLRFQRNETLISKKRNCENEVSLTETTYINYKHKVKEDREVILKNHSRMSLSEFLINKKEVEEISSEVVGCIKYFLKAFKEYRRQEHPPLKPEQWQALHDTLMSADCDTTGRSFDFTLPEMEDMIDRYFQTEFEGCSYNILHFNTNGIKARRAYEAGQYPV